MNYVDFCIYQVLPPHSKSVSLCFKLSINSASLCDLLASLLAQMVERQAVGPGFYPWTKRNYLTVMLFLRNRHGFPLSLRATEFVFIVGGRKCDSRRNAYNTKGGREECRRARHNEREMCKVQPLGTKTMQANKSDMSHINK